MENKPPSSPSIELKSSETTPEYSFEEGAEEICSRIANVLKNQPYAVVGFCASGSNVGKTQLLKTLSNMLYRQGIHIGSYKGVEDVGDHPLEKECRVVIFEELIIHRLILDEDNRMRRFYNNSVSTALMKVGCNVEGIDLWVGIYRPDKPFNKSTEGTARQPIADIIIRNDQAKDK